MRPLKRPPNIIFSEMLRFLIRLLIGILIWGILAWKIGPAGIFRNILQFRILALLLINLTTIGASILGGIGVIILGRYINPYLEWRQGLKGFLASTSLALFLPGRVGDFSLPYYWRHFMRSGESLSIVFLDKMITLFWVLMFGSCGIFIIFHNYMGFVIAGAGLFFILFLFVLIAIPKTRVLFSAILPGKILELLEGSMNAFRTIANKGQKGLFKVSGLTVIRISVYGLGFWLSLWGLDVAIPLYYAILIMALAQFTSLIPISIMGLGPVEAVCVYALSQIDVEPSSVMAALVATRFIALLWLCIFFIFFNVDRSGHKA